MCLDPKMENVNNIFDIDFKTRQVYNGPRIVKFIQESENNFQQKVIVEKNNKKPKIKHNLCLIMLATNTIFIA